MIPAPKNGGCNPAEKRNIMVVAEPTHESAAALRYVLSHVVFDNDTLYLLHVENPTFWKKRISGFMNQPSSSSATIPTCHDGGHGHCSAGGCIGGNVDFLNQMKDACESMHPKMKVKVSKVEMGTMEKANVIISQTNVHGIDLLVVGKRQSISTAIIWQGKNWSIRGELAEYLIENSKCTCVAVQSKGHTGGYLLHTKTHRNYWLLA